MCTSSGELQLRHGGEASQDGPVHKTKQFAIFNYISAWYRAISTSKHQAMKLTRDKGVQTQWPIALFFGVNPPQATRRAMSLSQTWLTGSLLAPASARPETNKLNQHFRTAPICLSADGVSDAFGCTRASWAHLIFTTSLEMSGLTQVKLRVTSVTNSFRIWWVTPSWDEWSVAYRYILNPVTAVHMCPDTASLWSKKHKEN
jgi:hypothetical protein